MGGRRMLQRSRLQMLGRKTITERRSTMTDWSLKATACSAAVLVSLLCHICLTMLICRDLALSTAIMLLWPFRILEVTSDSDSSV